MSKNGLFGSFGANGGDPSEPLIKRWGATYHPNYTHPHMSEEECLRRLGAAADEEETKLLAETAALEAIEAAAAAPPSPWDGDDTGGVAVLQIPSPFFFFSLSLRPRIDALLGTRPTFPRSGCWSLTRGATCCVLGERPSWVFFSPMSVCN